jgi:hypothetical protein
MNPNAELNIVGQANTEVANFGYKNIPLNVILLPFTEGMTLTGTHCSYIGE